MPWCAFNKKNSCRRRRLFQTRKWKMLSCLHAAMEISQFELYWLCCINLQKHVLEPLKHQRWINLWEQFNNFKITLLTIFEKNSIVMFDAVLNKPLTCSDAGNELNITKFMSRNISFDFIRYVNFIKILQLRWSSGEYLDFTVSLSLFHLLVW